MSLVLMLVFLIFANTSLNLVMCAEYVNPAKGISFQYDDALWEIMPSKGNHHKKLEDVDRAMADLTIVSLQRKIPDQNYYPRFSVVRESLERFGKTSSERFVNYRHYVLKFLKDQRFRILEVQEQRLLDQSFPAFQVEAHQRDFGLVFKKVVVIAEPYAYLVTFAARVDKINDYQKEFEGFIQSFKIRQDTSR